MNKLERQIRNEKIAKMGFAGLKMEIGLTKVLWNMEGMHGLSKSSLRKIIKDAQDKCKHTFIRPYELSPKYIVCKTCWLEKPKKRI